MAKGEKSVHQGHRQRLKERFLKEGLDNFEEHQVLELLLFYGIPQRDTNEIAHELIKKFGSLSDVLEATSEELAEVRFVGENVSTLFKLVTAVSRHYQISCAMKEVILNHIEDCGRYLVPFFYGRNQETVFLLCLDAKRKVLCCEKVGQGGVNSAGVPIRQIVETALKANASTAILAHNHPSGLALPSREDVQTTRRVAAALDAVEVELTDHIIVADNDWVSLAQSGLYRPEECRIML
jgi:DNA repair protein RadC